MHGTQSMMKTCVLGAGVDQMRQSGLFDPPEALKEGMFDYIIQESGPDMDQAIYWIINQLPFVHKTRLRKYQPPRIRWMNTIT